MTADLSLTKEQKEFIRAIRANPKFRGRRFRDLPRHRRLEGYTFMAGCPLVVLGSLLLVNNAGAGYVLIGSGILLLNFLALPYILVFFGYWFPKATLWGAKLDCWLEKDFKE